MIDFKQIKLSPGLKYTLRSMLRGKKYSGVIENSCNIPYRSITVDAESNCFLCGCSGWLPIPAGKVSDFDSIESVFNSPVAKMLQQDIDQKKFTWCAVEHCGIINGNNINNFYSLSISIDDSCNLACPSCRREMLMITSGPEYEKKIKDVDRILHWLERFESPIMISLGGTGDALASLICRNIIKNYRFRDGQTFIISTNGLLLKKVMSESPMLPAVSFYNVSVDAGSKSVYENVRRPGKWENLIENLEWLAEHKQNALVTLSFVLQNANYQDLPAFVELCQKYGFRAFVQPLKDWGTWNDQPVLEPDTWTVANGTYQDHNVADPAHPNHDHFVEILNLIRSQNHSFVNINSFFYQFK